jgi:hypothetical protein
MLVINISMSQLSIEKFISNIDAGGGLASPNKYRVEFANPVMGMNESVSIMCNVSSLPSRGIVTTESRHFNTPYQLPYSTTYPDITFSFVNTIGLKERDYFVAWQEYVIDPSTGLIGFYDEFKGDIDIYQLDGQGNDAYHIKLYDAYPLDINEVSLGYSMSNDTLISGVTFSYKYWETKF